MSRNALGKIFKVEKQLGRGDLFEVISVFPGGREETRIFQHEDCDGLGALHRLSLEWNAHPLELPSFGLSPRMSTLPRGISGIIRDLQPHQTRWKQIDLKANYTPRLLARRVLSKHATVAVVAAASKHNVNLNTLLLWCFNKSVCEELLATEQQHCHWLLPVNMRRAKDSSCSSNQTSSIGLHFDRKTTLSELFRTYKESVNPWQALGNEKLTELLASLSEKQLLALARLRGEKNSWLGSFSNLGRWDFPSLQENPLWPTHISIAPPAGTPCFPIGIGIITWQGHMSLSIRLHAALCGSNLQLQESVLDSAMHLLESYTKTQLQVIATSCCNKSNQDKIQEHKNSFLLREQNTLCNADNCASHSN
ncbi:MAG: hypothetical protein FJY29_12675 [Betaproteobacteria bacterium]|nr:hypothetical protein [Betaproteobacteria bacterium]